MSDKVKVVLITDEWDSVMEPILDLVGDKFFEDCETDIPRDLLRRHEEAKAAFDLIQEELFTYHRQMVDAWKDAKRYGRAE